jgi:hypothetical protein
MLVERLESAMRYRSLTCDHNCQRHDSQHSRHRNCEIYRWIVCLQVCMYYFQAVRSIAALSIHILRALVHAKSRSI